MFKEFLYYFSKIIEKFSNKLRELLTHHMEFLCKLWQLFQKNFAEILSSSWIFFFFNELVNQFRTLGYV